MSKDNGESSGGAGRGPRRGRGLARVHRGTVL